MSKSHSSSAASPVCLLGDPFHSSRPMPSFSCVASSGLQAHRISPDECRPLSHVARPHEPRRSGDASASACATRRKSPPSTQPSRDSDPLFSSHRAYFDRLRKEYLMRVAVECFRRGDPRHVSSRRSKPTSSSSRAHPNAEATDDRLPEADVEMIAAGTEPPDVHRYFQKWCLRTHLPQSQPTRFAATAITTAASTPSAASASTATSVGFDGTDENVRFD